MKTLTSPALGVLAATGSLILLAGAFFFQALGYAPCAMCLWQRWPHALAILCGAGLLAGFAPRVFLGLGFVSTATTAGIGVFHTGVERGWWEGPTSCTGSGADLLSMSGADLLPSAASGAANIVMCDEVAWEFLTLSMASWNALFSGALMVVWGMAIWRNIGRA